MLTRCPQCQTMFRVSPDQLKVRLGRVRCGRCRGEFNALDTLIDDTPPPLPVVTAETTEPGGIWLSQREAEVAPEETAIPTTEAPAMPPPLPEETALPAIEAPIEPPTPSAEAEAPAVVANEAHAQTDLPTDSPADIPADSPPDSPPAPSPPPPSESSPLPLPAAAGPFTLMEMVADEPEPPPRRWPWVVGTVCALIALALQVALHYRVGLAAKAPALRPALVMACDLLGCEVALPADIAPIGIDTSDLHPDGQRPNHLQLVATLRNRAPYAQAWPHLEVTLTDAGDHVLVRKAIPPGDYLQEKQKLSAGFPARGEQSVQLDLQTDLAAVGYRLYVFYP